MVLIRPNSADLDYAFQQSGNKLREVVFNSGEFARIRLICAFFLFMCNVQKLHISIYVEFHQIKFPHEFGGIKINQHSMILRIPDLQTVRAVHLITTTVPPHAILIVF